MLHGFKVFLDLANIVFSTCLLLFKKQTPIFAKQTFFASRIPQYAIMYILVKGRFPCSCALFLGISLITQALHP